MILGTREMKCIGQAKWNGEEEEWSEGQSRDGDDQDQEVDSIIISCAANILTPFLILIHLPGLLMLTTLLMQDWVDPYG